MSSARGNPSSWKSGSTSKKSTIELDTICSGLTLIVARVRVIVLYFEKGMELILLDDGEARKVAESLGMKITGTGGLLLLAKQQGLIGSVRSEIDKLEKEGEFRLSDSVGDILLQSAGE